MDLQMCARAASGHKLAEALMAVTVVGVGVGDGRFGFSVSFILGW